MSVCDWAKGSPRRSDAYGVPSACRTDAKEAESWLPGMANCMMVMFGQPIIHEGPGRDDMGGGVYIEVSYSAELRTPSTIIDA